ncbi:MAG: PfkB family carbohydrate kinase [Clostridium sp.]|nr:PfkB family carbohydrate kinase [Clostridium sp.]
MEKKVSKQEFAEIRKELRRQGKRVILCHGVFDLIHPGHIQHFQEAKSLGDVLVVSVTAANYVRKGPGRPYFNDRLRLESLAAIECIDYVLLSENYTVEDIIEVVQPDLYVKGQEYKKAEDDITGKITEEVELVRKYGGDIYFTSGDVFSSTKLINQAFPVFSEELKEYLSEFKKRWTMDKLHQYVDRMQQLHVLVVGDIIIDDYVYCKVQGLMSKNNGYSAKFIKEEKYLGGSIAIARHLSAFTENVTLLSVMGQEAELEDLLDNECKGKIVLDLVRTPEVATIIKKRYVEPDDKRKELNKIFVINNLPEKIMIKEEVLSIFKERLKAQIAEYDAVFLCDFGHGLIDEETIDIIQNGAKKLILNCQTNSSNYGLNLITKYQRADYFSLDEKELRLAFSNYKKTEEELLLALSNALKAKGWLTRGSKGALYVENGELADCPAFVLDVFDTIGAGDAFFSLAGLIAAAGAPVEVGTFLGNVAGALAANIVGNKDSLNKVDTLKFITTLLKG